MMLVAHHDNSPADVLFESFDCFLKSAGSLLHIRSDRAYQKALVTLSDVMERADDRPDDPYVPLIEMLSNAIERYENSLPAVQALEKRVDEMDAGVSTLRLLMSQYGLTGSDFENEIGKRSYVSLILKEERSLTRAHIEKLSKRFSISPALFF